jgi:hypothetical protein
MKFERDENKAAANLEKHGVSFDEAQEVFDDPSALVRYDEVHSIAEDRFIIIGYSRSNLLLVIFAERGADLIRLISARLAARREQKEYEEEAE